MILRERKRHVDKEFSVWGEGRDLQVERKKTIEGGRGEGTAVDSE